jgi:hypothetical protein
MIYPKIASLHPFIFWSKAGRTLPGFVIFFLLLIFASGVAQALTPASQANFTAQKIFMVDNPAEGLRLLASGKHDAIQLSKLTGMPTLQGLGLISIEPWTQGGSVRQEEEHK